MRVRWTFADLDFDENLDTHVDQGDEIDDIETGLGKVEDRLASLEGETSA